MVMITLNSLSALNVNWIIVKYVLIMKPKLTVQSNKLLIMKLNVLNVNQDFISILQVVNATNAILVV